MGRLLAEDEGVDQDFKLVRFTEFGASSLDFTLRIWSATFDESIRLRSEVNVMVNDALKEAGIEIPFPQRDVHIHNVPAE